MRDAMDRIIAENQRLHTERDRLFGSMVAIEQINRPDRVISRHEAIRRVLVLMATLDVPNPAGEIARELAEYDRLSAEPAQAEPAMSA